LGQINIVAPRHFRVAAGAALNTAEALYSLASELR
jgi:hypothetical protein